MKIFTCFLALACCFAATTAFAQPGAGTPQQDIRTAVRELSAEQKLKVLDYMRYLGISVEKETQQGYEQLNNDKRARVLQYIGIQKQDPDAPLPLTSVQWNRDTIHFGSIEENSVLLDSFTVTNTGYKPYVIKDIKTSCDCTVLSYPIFPLMPGETTALRIEFDSRSKVGPTQPGIIIYDNSSPNGRNILYLNGEVYARKEVKKIGG